MIKVVINNCHGGFGLSSEAQMVLINENSVLVSRHPLTEYTGKETLGEAIRDLTEAYDGSDGSTDLGNGFRAGLYGQIFNVDDGMVYEISYHMPQQAGEPDEHWWQRTEWKKIYFRTHPDIINIVERLGDKANSQYARLVIVEVPDEDITVEDLDIGEYDGSEWVEERHRTWS